MPELGRLSRRQIAALTGLAPWTRQPGLWRGKSFIGGGGRAPVRKRTLRGRIGGQPARPDVQAFS